MLAVANPSKSRTPACLRALRESSAGSIRLQRGNGRDRTKSCKIAQWRAAVDEDEVRGQGNRVKRFVTKG